MPVTQCGDSELKTACFGEKPFISMVYIDGREFKGILGVEELFTECYIKNVTYSLNTGKLNRIC